MIFFVQQSDRDVLITLKETGNRIHNKPPAKRSEDERKKTMRTIRFNEFKNLPVHVLVMYIAALLIAVTGMVLLILNILEIGNLPLAAGMACIVAAQVINLFGICKYKDRLYQ